MNQRSLWIERKEENAVGRNLVSAYIGRRSRKEFREVNRFLQECQRSGSDENNPNENDTVSQKEERRMLCLRRTLPKGRCHPCQLLQLSCCSQPGLWSEFSLYNEDILTQRTIACPTSLMSYCQKWDWHWELTISHVPGSPLSMYHLSVFTERNSERTHIRRDRILTCEMFWIAYSIFLLYLRAKSILDLFHGKLWSMNQYGMILLWHQCLGK